MPTLVQFLLIFSVMVITVIIFRLYRGIQLLNSRVDLLSNLLKRIRLELLEIQKLEEDQLEVFFSYDSELNSKLKKDFRSRRPIGLERLQSYREKTKQESPAKKSKNTGDKDTLNVYEVGREGQVKIKKDLSYMMTSSGEKPTPVVQEEIPEVSLPLPGDSDKK